MNPAASEGLTAGQLVLHVADVAECDDREAFAALAVQLDRDHDLGLLSDNDRRHVIAKMMFILMATDDDMTFACLAVAHEIDGGTPVADPLDNPIMFADAFRRIGRIFA